MKIMVPVSQQDCVFVRKDGLEKTALKVGMYSQCIVVSTQILSVWYYSHLAMCELKTQSHRD